MFRELMMAEYVCVSNFGREERIYMLFGVGANPVLNNQLGGERRFYEKHENYLYHWPGITKAGDY